MFSGIINSTKSRRFLPILSVIIGSASVYVNNSIIISGLLAKTAKWRHEYPLILVCELGLAPLFKSIRTISSFPKTTANCKGVHVFLKASLKISSS